MSVLIETTVGNILVNLKFDEFHIESYNFLKLCKVNYYKYQCFYNVRKNNSIEFGDALEKFNDRRELRVHDTSISALLNVNSKNVIQPLFIKSSKSPKRSERRNKKGKLSFIVTYKDNNESVPLIGSKVLLHLNDTDAIDNKAICFGDIPEKYWEVLDTMNNCTLNKNNKLIEDIRIIDMHIIVDPFPDPDGLTVFKISQPFKEVSLPVELINKYEQDSELYAIKDDIARKELALEVMGDIPSSGVKLLENILFICKLNSLTKAEDIAMIFQRFGDLLSVEIVRDKDTGSSLGYGFIEFEKKKSCEEAYRKMEGIIIDDRKIHVDFCQSVSKLAKQWATDQL